MRPNKAIFYVAVIAAAGLWSESAAARTLTTPDYIVTLRSHCPEGEVGCQRVTYHGVSRKTGRAVTLNGTTRMVMCADGTTPCHVGDYEFHNGAYLYSVYPDGHLVVTRHGRVIVDQAGAWSD